MTYFSDYAVQKGIETITKTSVSLFGGEATQRQIEQQRDVFEDRADITNVLDIEQEVAKDKGKSFIPNMERATNHGVRHLESGIGMRLKGAYALYRSGDEMECIRYILLALGTVCHALGWKKADLYLNEQNIILFKMKKEKEMAGG